MLLPECRWRLADADSLWLCGYSLSFGSFCLLTLALGVFTGRQIWPLFARTRWYLPNLCMLALTVLTALQMVLLALECLVVSDTHLLMVVRYFRDVQVAISCMLYGKSACYDVREPCHDSSLTGAKLLDELLRSNSPARFYEHARMEKPTFLARSERHLQLPGPTVNTG